MIPLLMVQAIFTSCKKEELGDEPVLKVSFDNLTATSVATTGTKASGSDHGSSTFDQQVNTLQIFVFNTATGTLDAYEEVTGPITISNYSLDIPVSTGNKTVYAVANAHNPVSLKDVFDISGLNTKILNIRDEDVKDFCMVGSAVSTVTSSGSASARVELSRNISRVELLSVKSALVAGYSSMAISNVKAYLINVNPNSNLISGEGSGTKLNQNALVPADTLGCSMTGMLCSNLPNITSTANSTDYYFYCYANNDANAKTMLVIEGTLNGTTYYYPIIIKDNATGYNLSPNTSYKISELVITRPGSDVPYQEVEKGTIHFTLTVLDWTTREYNTITI